jgi:hypothetical protein
MFNSRTHLVEVQNEKQATVGRQILRLLYCTCREAYPSPVVINTKCILIPNKISAIITYFEAKIDCRYTVCITPIL